MGAKGKIGLIGLAVMGANLARNLAGHGISTVVYNRSRDKTENFLKEFGSDTNLSGAAALEELVNSLEKPRKIILMIKAGEAVDAMIAKLVPFLEKVISLLTVGTPSLKIPGVGAGKWKRWGFTLWAWAYPVVKKGRSTAPALCPAAPARPTMLLRRY